MARQFPVNVFVSGQQTSHGLKVLTEVCDKMGTLKNIKASACEMNIRESKWVVNTAYNAGVFGVAIPTAIHRLFNCDRVHRLMAKRFPKLADSKFVFQTLFQDKLRADKKLDVFFEALRQNGAESTVRKMEHFKNKYLSLNPSTIKDMNDWFKFMESCGIPKGWEYNLQYTDVLTWCFGCNKEVAEKVCNLDIDQVKMSHYGLRWFVKAMTSLSLDGCQSDIVNATLAIIKCPTLKPSEQEVVEAINKLLEVINDEITPLSWLSAQLWIPEVVFHDSELDDVKAVVLFDVLCEKFTFPYVHQIVQLPNEYEDYCKRLRSQGHVVFYDPQSKNEKAVNECLALIE